MNDEDFTDESAVVYAVFEAFLMGIAALAGALFACAVVGVL